MKTEGLTIQQAVEMLEIGRCDGITCQDMDGNIRFSNGRLAVYLQDDMVHDRWTPTKEQIKSISWQLVNPRRRKETRTLEGWVNVYENKQKLSAFHTSKDEAINGAWGETVACVHVTGTYEVEIDE